MAPAPRAAILACVPATWRANVLSEGVTGRLASVAIFQFNGPVGSCTPSQCERRTVAIEYRWVEGRNEPAEIVAEFVRLKVDTIVTYGTPSILAAKQATSVIPCIVGNRASSAEVAIGTRADALFVILDPPLERLESGNDILSFSDFR